MAIAPKPASLDDVAAFVRSQSEAIMLMAGYFDRVGILQVEHDRPRVIHDLRITPACSWPELERGLSDILCALARSRSPAHRQGRWDVFHLTAWQHAWTHDDLLPFQCWGHHGVLLKVTARDALMRDGTIPLGDIARVEAFRTESGSRHGVHIVKRDETRVPVAERREWVAWFDPTYGPSMESEFDVGWAEMLAADIASSIPGLDVPKRRMILR